jgi:predicted transcriptional regulator
MNINSKSFFVFILSILILTIFILQHIKSFAVDYSKFISIDYNSLSSNEINFLNDFNLYLNNGNKGTCVVSGGNKYAFVIADTSAFYIHSGSVKKLSFSTKVNYRVIVLSLVDNVLVGDSANNNTVYSSSYLPSFAVDCMYYQLCNKYSQSYAKNVGDVYGFIYQDFNGENNLICLSKYTSGNSSSSNSSSSNSSVNQNIITSQILTPINSVFLSTVKILLPCAISILSLIISCYSVFFAIKNHSKG